MSGLIAASGDFSKRLQSHYRLRYRLAYLLAPLLVLAALAVRLNLPASFGERPLLLLFLLPVIVSALLGGLGPGLWATALAAAVTGYYLAPPYHNFAIVPVYDKLQWGMLIVNGALVSLLSELLLRSRQIENARWHQLVQTQHQLLHSETLLQATFEQAAVAMGLLTPDGSWFKVNSKFCELVGYSQEDLLSCKALEICHSEDTQGLSRLLADDLNHFSEEMRFIRKNGSIAWVNVNAASVRDPDGRLDYFIWVLDDIEQREQAAQALKASETALNVAQRLAGLGSWSWDLRTNALNWSEQTYRIFARDPNLPPADYDEVAAYFKPDSWQRLNAAVARASSEGVAYECEAELLSLGEQCRWVVARGEPVRDEQGHIVLLHGTVQDISARKRAELTLRETQAVALKTQREARQAALNLMEDALAAGKALEMANTSLRESQEFKRAILDSVSANIAVLDREGVIVAVNLPWQQFAQDNADACGQSMVVCGIGTHYLQVSEQASGPYRQDASAVFAGLSAVLAGRLPNFRYEYACHSPGQQRWFSMVATPLALADGGAVVAHTNITERKLAEIALIESEERLRLAQSSANIGIWDWHIASGKVQWTAELEAMFGYEPGTFPGDYQAFSRYVHPDDLAILEQQREAAVAAHHTFDFDFRVQLEAGGIRWLNSKGGAHYDESGQAKRVFGVCIDITEQKAAEAALRERTDALQRFNRAMVGREMDMIALKQQINELSLLLGQEEPYPLTFLDQIGTNPKLAER